jgi:hypothetical protein
VAFEQQSGGFPCACFFRHGERGFSGVVGFRREAHGKRDQPGRMKNITIFLIFIAMGASSIGINNWKAKIFWYYWNAIVNNPPGNRATEPPR